MNKRLIIFGVLVVFLSFGLAYICIAPPTDLPNWPLYTVNSKVWQTVDRWGRTVKPYHIRVQEMASQYLVSRTMYLLCYIGVPDVLSKQNKPVSCEELKPLVDRKYVGEPVNLVFFCRLLHAAAHFDLLEENGENKYQLTELSKYLVSTHPKSLKYFVLMIAGDEGFVVATSLTRSIFTGVSGFKETYRVELLEQMKKDPIFREVFDKGQGDASRLVAPALIADYPPFGTCKHICDIGGGVGSFLYQVLVYYRFTMKGTLFDLPEVTVNAKKFLAQKEVKDADIRIVPGDFFEDVPEMGCDCYVAKDIINNWSDEASVTILTNIHKSMKPGSRLLIMERIMHTADYAEERLKALMDLTMMSFNPSQSRLRTQEEFYFLLEQTGFISPLTYTTRAGYSIIQTTPKTTY